MNTFNVEWMNLDLGFAVTLPAELFPFKILIGKKRERGRRCSSPSLFLPLPWSRPPTLPVLLPGTAFRLSRMLPRRRFAT